MAPPKTSTDFDEGIFLVHLNKGKELLGGGALEEAREQLEKARSLRPDEDRVLNLLGMLYFKMEKHTEAREVYLRLIGIHPNEAVLHLNLGILEFKENRFQDAERHLQQAQEISPDNPKPHMYLGLIYNKQDDLERAAEHLKRAGATRLLEKVEQKRRQRSAAHVDGTNQARGSANFRVQDGAGSAQKEVPPGPQQPPLTTPDIDSILAGLSALGDAPTGIIQAPPDGESEPAVVAPPAPLQPLEPRAPASLGSASTAPPVSLDPSTVLDLGAAPIAAARLGANAFGPFRHPGAGLLSMEVASSAFIRRGSVTHYSGRLDFSRDRHTGLILVKGQGTLFLSQDGERTLLVELAGHTLSVSSAHLLACSEGIQIEDSALALGTGESSSRALRLLGQGCVALAVDGETLCLDVEVERPAAADPRRVVAWSGELRAEALASEILREVMTAGAQGVLSVRFEGRGTVLVEQSAVQTSPASS
ncbi:MAG: tetratricopeptide repeat protein [Acidobacteriota bacterium]